MFSSWATFVIGVLSGLTTTILIWLATKQAWPRLRNLLQKGPRISGQWKSNFVEDGVTKSENVEVSQTGERISGTMTLTEDETIIRSRFSGTIQSGVIKGLYENQNPEGFEQGAFALHLEPHGRRAKGQYIYFVSQEDGSNSEITASNYSWKRV